MVPIDPAAASPGDQLGHWMHMLDHERQFTHRLYNQTERRLTLMERGLAMFLPPQQQQPRMRGSSGFSQYPTPALGSVIAGPAQARSFHGAGQASVSTAVARVPPYANQSIFAVGPPAFGQHQLQQPHQEWSLQQQAPQHPQQWT